MGAFVLLAVSLACASTRLKPMGTEPGRFRPEGDEARLWDDARGLQRRIDQSDSVYRDSALEAYVTGVARRVVAANLDSTAFAPRVRIFTNPLLNAFALPHGAVYVHTGILARLDNEAQLATLLGHELTHITNRHGLRELRSARNKHALAQIVSGVTTVAGVAALGAGAGSALGSLTGSLADLWMVSAVLGYSRELESEADAGGLEAMTRAGYDPCEAPKLFEHLQRVYDPPSVPESYFYGTHPRLQVRLGNYLNLLGRRCIDAVPDSGPPRRDDYPERMATLMLDNAVLDLRIGRINTADVAVSRHLEIRPGSPRGHFMRGEIERRRGRADLAIAAYTEAGRLDVTYADPHRELGLLYRELGRGEDARAALQRYLDLSPAAVDAPIIDGYLTQLRTP
jgi:predicted Zn-dependent protease